MFSVSQNGMNGNWKIEGPSNPYVDEAFRIMRNRAAESKPICLFDGNSDEDEYVELVIPASASITFVRRKANPTDGSWGDMDPEEVEEMTEGMKKQAEATGMIIYPGLLQGILDAENVQENS